MIGGRCFFKRLFLGELVEKIVMERLQVMVKIVFVQLTIGRKRESMFFLCVIAGIIVLYVIWQYQELKKFRVTAYEMESGKVNGEIKLVVISDLHSFSYGRGNERLVRAVEDEKPDLILIPGDLIVTALTAEYETAAEFAERIVKIAPVVFSNGNHESRAEPEESHYSKVYKQYRRRLERAGVLILNNAHHGFTIRGTQVRVSGLEVPLSSYKKGKKPYLEETFITAQLGQASEHLQILLAHHPAFARQYADWGADITVCGHNHGGLVRIPGIGSIISPQFRLFPKYDAGEFTFGNRKVYISRGLGSHTFHIRICNRAELVAVTVKNRSKIT